MIEGVYTAYTEIRKIFFPPYCLRWRQQVSSSTTTAQRNCADLDHSYSKWIQMTAVLSKIIFAIMWSKFFAVNQQWLRSSLLQESIKKKGIGYHCRITVFQKRPQFQLLQKHIPTMGPSHAGCLTPRKNAIMWQTDTILKRFFFHVNKYFH